MEPVRVKMRTSHALCSKIQLCPLVRLASLSSLLIVNSHPPIILVLANILRKNPYIVKGNPLPGVFLCENYTAALTLY